MPRHVKKTRKKKKLTPAEQRRIRARADAIKDSNPGIADSTKFAIATAQIKRKKKKRSR